MSECLFTVPVKILISQYEVIWFATWKEIGKKKRIFQKSSSHYVYVYVFINTFSQSPCWCLRTTSAVQDKLQPHHQEMLEPCPQAGKQAEKEQEVLPKSLKDFFQHR